MKCASSSSDSSPCLSSTLCSLFLVFFVTLKYYSLFDCSFFVSILISYAARVPCSSSIVILVKSLVYSMAENLASYLRGSDLNTFYTTKESLTSSPNPLMALTTSSTLSK
jgi:hypothetical protein